MSELPISLGWLLLRFRPCLTAPSFATFEALVVGFVTRVGEHTITGCLLASGMASEWHHSRAHRFFSRARWSPDRLGLALLDFVVETLCDPALPLLFAVDDTLLKRSGRKVWGAAWHHDPAGEGVARKRKLGWGNCWVVVGIVIWPPFLHGRPVCLPVLFRLWRKQPGRSRLVLARELLELLAQRYDQRRIHVVADSGYHGRTIAALPEHVTLTLRLRRDAALHALPAPRGQPAGAGRPRIFGQRLPTLGEIASDPATPWQTERVYRYGRWVTVQTHSFHCYWRGVFARRVVLVVIEREHQRNEGYDLALVSTDIHARPGRLIERFAARWSIETAFQDAKQLAGVGQARNRTPKAVERTAPFAFLCLSITIAWYTHHGHDPADVHEHRQRARWYTTKRTPSLADMLAKLRRTIIAAQFSPGPHRNPTPHEIHAIQQAWAAAGT